MCVHLSMKCRVVLWSGVSVCVDVDADGTDRICLKKHAFLSLPLCWAHPLRCGLWSKVKGIPDPYC